MFKLSNIVKWFIENILNLTISEGLGAMLHFFIYASIEILALMAIIVMGIGLLRSYINPQKLKNLLTRTGTVPSHILSALLGAITPFCSCSSVPVFIGFIESGIPLGATFSFLITSPIVNEAAIAMLWIAFGWKIAIAYTLTGIIIGVVGGLIIEKMNLEHLLEDYIQMRSADIGNLHFNNFADRIRFAYKELKDVMSNVWKYVLLGLMVGAIIKGWTPDNLLTKYAGPNNPFAVLVGVLVGVPVYASNVMMIPIIETLIGKGMGVGTALAFMMAASALSLPEMIMLRKVLKTNLVKIFVAITSIGIISVGYLFNFLLTGLI